MASVDNIALRPLLSSSGNSSLTSSLDDANRDEVDLRALVFELKKSTSEFVLFSLDKVAEKKLPLLPSSAVHADIVIGRHEKSAQDGLFTRTKPLGVEGSCTGLSLVDRLSLNSLWDHDFGLSPSGKVFNRLFLLAFLENLPDDVTHIQRNIFVLCLYLLADKVDLADATLQIDGNELSNDSPVLSGSNSSLLALESALGQSYEHSGYSFASFSKWLAIAYVDLLVKLKQNCSDQAFCALVQSLDENISHLPKLYSSLFLSGITQLPAEINIWLNALKQPASGSEYEGLVNSIGFLKQQAVVLDNRDVQSSGLKAEADKLLVSIVTVVRNLFDSDRIGLFEAMLDSVSAQDYPSLRLEHLVVDGSSTDGSVEYLTALWREGRITRLVSEPDTSVYNAMNKAMSYVNGDCFLFLNSDDYLAPDAISRLVRALEDESADYAFADAWQIDDKNNKVGVVKGEIDSAWFKVPFCHQTLLCRTFPLSSHRFDESYKITMMKYALDLRAGPYKGAYVPEKLAYYRVGDGVSSAPANRSRYLEETYRVKDYSADMLGLPRELYEDLDQAWRRVSSERHYQRLVALVDEVRADMPATELTETFCESVKRFGRYRLEQHLEKHPADQPAPVRLALFNSHAYGGAGSAVLRLHLALRDTPGIRPTLITRDMVEDRVIPDSRLIEEPEGGWNAWQDRVRTAPGATQFTVDESCIPQDMLDDIIDAHDVFSLQWTARMLSVRDIGRIVGSGKPVFITVRDMEPITGGCHYFHGCMKWRYEQCRGCPQIVTGDKRLASDAFAEKLQVLTRPNVTFVALSDISEAVLRQSPLAYANPIVRIGNGFDPDTFRVLDRRQARQALGLDEGFSGRYLIGMMPSFSSSVKGFDVALSALRQAEQASAGFSERTGLLVAGYPGDTDDLGGGLPVEAIGALGDAGALNLFYSACDLLVVPSREETFSNTVAEALLCGTPVFGARAGAIPEMITDEVNGRLFSHDWDSARIAQALIECCEKDFSREVCRAAITDFFPQDQQVARYVEFFSQALTG